MKTWLERLNTLETPICLRWNGWGELRLDTQRFFGVVSRLGDGVFWYLLMFVLPIVYGSEGVRVSLQMLTVGLVSLLIYKSLKLRTMRPRPCDLHSGIRAGIPPLDKFSFPSGHTMHAVGFTIVVLHYYPPIGLLLLPFVILVAASRLILGLHYPSDVLVGAVLGASVAGASLYFVN